MKMGDKHMHSKTRLAYIKARNDIGENPNLLNSNIKFMLARKTFHANHMDFKTNL